MTPKCQGNFWAVDERRQIDFLLWRLKSVRKGKHYTSNNAPLGHKQEAAWDGGGRGKFTEPNRGNWEEKGPFEEEKQSNSMVCMKGVWEIRHTRLFVET